MWCNLFRSAIGGCNRRKYRTNDDTDTPTPSLAAAIFNAVTYSQRLVQTFLNET